MGKRSICFLVGERGKTQDTTGTLIIFCLHGYCGKRANLESRKPCIPIAWSRISASFSLKLPRQELKVKVRVVSCDSPSSLSHVQVTTCLSRISEWTDFHCLFKIECPKRSPLTLRLLCCTQQWGWWWQSFPASGDSGFSGERWTQSGSPWRQGRPLLFLHPCPSNSVEKLLYAFSGPPGELGPGDWE